MVRRSGGHQGSCLTEREGEKEVRADEEEEVSSGQVGQEMRSVCHRHLYLFLQSS